MCLELNKFRRQDLFATLGMGVGDFILFILLCVFHNCSTIVRPFVDPILGKYMFENPNPISLKWPIRFFLLYSKTACHPLN